MSNVFPRVPREGPDERWYADVEDAIKVYSVTIDPSAVAANSTSEQTFTVTGINSLDKIVINKPTHTAGLGICNVRASAKDTIAITFFNITGSSIDPGSEKYNIIAIRE